PAHFILPIRGHAACICIRRASCRVFFPNNHLSCQRARSLGSICRLPTTAAPMWGGIYLKRQHFSGVAQARQSALEAKKNGPEGPFSGGKTVTCRSAPSRR